VLPWALNQNWKALTAFSRKGKILLDLAHAHKTQEESLRDIKRSFHDLLHKIANYFKNNRRNNNCLYPRLQRQTENKSCFLMSFSSNIPVSWVSFHRIQKERAGHRTKQYKMPQGRGVTRLPVACSPTHCLMKRPRQGHAPLQPPVAVSRLSLQLLPSYITSFHWAQSYWVCLCNYITKECTIFPLNSTEFNLYSAVLQTPLTPQLQVQLKCSASLLHILEIHG
jgi:hypothetical protein